MCKLILILIVRLQGRLDDEGIILSVKKKLQPYNLNEWLNYTTTDAKHPLYFLNK